MFKGVPAVAVSTAIDLQLISQDQQAGYQKTLNAMDDTARFAVRVIDRAAAIGAEARRLCKKSKGKAKAYCETNVIGLPGTTGLNINYPALEAGQVKGVAFAPIGDWGNVNFAPQQGTDGVVRVNLVPPPAPTAEQKQADAYQLSLGKAVITVIDGNMTAGPLEQAQAKLILKGLTP
ncbi:hypothetical protein D9M70_398740 [compost metagenome]